MSNKEMDRVTTPVLEHKPPVEYIEYVIFITEESEQSAVVAKGPRVIGGMRAVKIADEVVGEEDCSLEARGYYELEDEGNSVDPGSSYASTDLSQRKQAYSSFYYKLSAAAVFFLVMLVGGKNGSATMGTPSNNPMTLSKLFGDIALLLIACIPTGISKVSNKVTSRKIKMLVVYVLSWHFLIDFGWSPMVNWRFAVQNSEGMMGGRGSFFYANQTLEVIESFVDIVLPVKFWSNHVDKGGDRGLLHPHEPLSTACIFHYCIPPVTIGA